MAFWVHGLFQYKYDEKSDYVAKSDILINASIKSGTNVQAIDNMLKELSPSLPRKCPQSEVCWSAFFLHFPAFRRNTKRYGVFLRIQSECRKIREKCSVFQNFLYRNFHNYECYKRMQPHSNPSKHRYGTVQLLNLKLQRSMYIIFQACYLQLHFFKMMRKIYQMMLSHYLQIFQQKKQSTIHFISQLRAKLNVAQFSNVRFA